MESRVEQAAERKMCGYNCAQAVACTYCDLAGIDEETVRNLTRASRQVSVAAWKPPVELSSVRSISWD